MGQITSSCDCRKGMPQETSTPTPSTPTTHQPQKPRHLKTPPPHAFSNNSDDDDGIVRPSTPATVSTARSSPSPLPEAGRLDITSASPLNGKSPTNTSGGENSVQDLETNEKVHVTKEVEDENSTQESPKELPQENDVVVVDLYKMENGMDSHQHKSCVDGDETEAEVAKEEQHSVDDALVDLSIPSAMDPSVQGPSCIKQDEEDLNPTIPTPASSTTSTSPLLLTATAKFSTWDIFVQPPTNITKHLTNNEEKGEEENDRIHPVSQKDLSASKYKRPFGPEDCPLILTQTKRFAVFSIQEEEEKVDEE